ncbi:MAG TPA: cytochrome B [Alphaproteobacteria bacterium]|nr:cytochrome B [Alphaproteobacteria bacterium]
MATAVESRGAATPREIEVWDPLVRAFHWSLLAAFFGALLTGDEFERLHVTLGYIVAGLVAFRLVWGVVGTRHARFSDFVYGPKTIAEHLRATMRLRARRYIGHNPAGGAMVIALLVMLAVVSLSGYMMTGGAFRNAEWLEELHEGAAYLTVGLIALHVVGVAVASLEHGEHLVRSMITGRKRAE